MTTHLHIQIQQLWQSNNTQAREAITEEINRLIKVKWIPELSFSMSMCCRSTACGYKRLSLSVPLQTDATSGLTWQSVKTLVRIAARGGDVVQETQPHFPLKNMPPSRMHQQLSCREQPHTLLACPAALPAQLSCRNSPQGKAQGKYRHGCVLQEPFSSFRNSYEAASYLDLLL